MGPPSRAAAADERADDGDAADGGRGRGRGGRRGARAAAPGAVLRVAAYEAAPGVLRIPARELRAWSADPEAFACDELLSESMADMEEEDDGDDAEPTSPISAATPETPCTEASPQTLDDRRYRASIHALEAEVDTLLSRAA